VALACSVVGMAIAGYGKWRFVQGDPLPLAWSLAWFPFAVPGLYLGVTRDLRRLRSSRRDPGTALVIRCILLGVALGAAFGIALAVGALLAGRSDPLASDRRSYDAIVAVVVCLSLGTLGGFVLAVVADGLRRWRESRSGGGKGTGLR
jgi:hypothetical protein